MAEQRQEGRYGFPVALSMVVGIVIGIGIFFKAKPVLLAAGGNPELAVAAWIIGGIMTIIFGLTAAEVGAAIPETGGMIAWIRKLYGDKIGFLVGWAQSFIYSPAIVAILAYYFVVFMFDFLGTPVDESTKYIVAIVTVTFVYIVNTYTQKAGGYIQTLATAIKLIPLFAITIFGIFSNNNPEPMAMSQEVVEATSGAGIFTIIGLIGAALVPIMFAFDGWVYVGAIAGDLKNVKRNLPNAIIWGIGLIILCYVGLNYAILNVFPASELMQQSGLSGVAAELFGPNAGQLILLGITISAFGGLNGNIMVSTRVPYALALEGHFPNSEYFKQLDPKSQQPARASWLMYGVSVFYLVVMWIMNDPDELSNIPVSLFFFFYLLVFYGVFILRTKFANLERPYSAPFYPVLPILALLGGIFVLYAALSGNGFYYLLVAVAFTLTGLFFYKGNK